MLEQFITLGDKMKIHKVMFNTRDWKNISFTHHDPSLDEDKPKMNDFKYEKGRRLNLLA